MPSTSLGIVNNPPDCVPRDAGEPGAAPSPSLTSLQLQTPELPCLISCHNSIQGSNEWRLFELLICQWRDTLKKVIAAQSTLPLPVGSICTPQMLEMSKSGAAAGKWQ